MHSFCISGAGPIGLAVALGLGQQNHRVLLLDHKKQIDEAILMDDRRMLALSHRTVEFFKRLNVWQEMSQYATAIDAVHVSQKNCSIEVTMKANQHDIDHFGCLVPQGQVILALYRAVLDHDNIELSLDSKILPNGDLHDGQVTIQKAGERFTEIFDWLIAAEGINSALRESFGIETFYRDYDQIAVIARVRFEKPHHNTAYERFTMDGPLALLPVNDHDMAVVLMADRADTEKWKRASSMTYAAEVLARIGARLGDITEVSELQVWPLTLMLPKRVVQGRLFLIGNSAHGLHPIAGQGLNLGIRDCEAIIDLLGSHTILTDEVLANFNEVRRKDILQTVGATDFLVNAFGIQGKSAQTARSLGLLGVKMLPFVKNKIAKIGMGY